MIWEFPKGLCAQEAQLQPSDLESSASLTKIQLCYLHGIVQEHPRAAEAAILLLILTEPDQSILDVLFIYEDVRPGLGKGLQDKGCEPVRETEQ